MMLIVFEGLDGVGKSTVINGVAERLNAKRMRTPSPSLREAREKCGSCRSGHKKHCLIGEHDGVR